MGDKVQPTAFPLPKPPEGMPTREEIEAQQTFFGWLFRRPPRKWSAPRWECACGRVHPIVKSATKIQCACGRTVPRDPGKPEWKGL